MSTPIFKITVRPGASAGCPVAVEQRTGEGFLPMGVQGELCLDLVALRSVALDRQAYGLQLGRALFVGQVREIFSLALGQTAGPLRLLLTVENPELASLAWEHLCAPIDGTWRPITGHQRIIYAYSIAGTSSRAFAAVTRQQLCALVLAANPSDLGRYGLAAFDASGALQSVRDALGSIPTTLLGPMPPGVAAPSLNALCRSLSATRHAILHLICHGRVLSETGETVLYLARDENPNATEPVTGSELLARFDLLGPSLPRLIFLATCSSAHREGNQPLRGLGQRLVSELGIPAVIAMNAPISMQTASELEQAFYQQLVVHGEPDRALAEASAGLGGRHDSHVPMLFSRLEGQALFTGHGTPASEAPSIDFSQLRALLTRHFSLEELDGLCADIEQELVHAGRALPVSLEVVGGVSKEGKILNLLRYLERKGEIALLVTFVSRHLPRNQGDDRSKAHQPEVARPGSASVVAPPEPGQAAAREEPREAGTQESIAAFIAGPPILHPRAFFGRETIVRRIFGLLKRVPLQNAVIIGPRRSGKTSLLHYLRSITRTPSAQLRPGQRNDWLEQPACYQWVMLDFQDARLSRKEGLLRALLAGMGLAIPEPCTLDRAMDVISNNLRQPTVILLDEVGKALQSYPDLDDDLWESLRSLGPQVGGQLGFVLATHSSPAILARDSGHSSPFFNIFGYTTNLGPFSEAEALQLIASSPLPFNGADTAWMLEQSGGWPILLQLLCRERLISLEDGDEDAAWREMGLEQVALFRSLL